MKRGGIRMAGYDKIFLFGCPVAASGASLISA